MVQQRRPQISTMDQYIQLQTMLAMPLMEISTRVLDTQMGSVLLLRTTMMGIGGKWNSTEFTQYSKCQLLLEMVSVGKIKFN